MPANNGSAESSVAHPGRKKSFQLAEERAREVLREKGMSEKQINAELRRLTRDHDA